MTVTATAPDPRRVAYIALSFLMALIAIVGFWPRYFGRVHPIYVLGLMVFIVRRYSVPLIAPSAEWGAFAQWAFGLVR